MPRKRRSSSVNLIETENLSLPNLPPWYVRVLIYSVVVFCFVLVFTLGPNSLGNTNENEHMVRDENGKVKTTNDAPYPPKIVSWNDISPNENLAHLCQESGTKPEFIICTSNNDHEMKIRNNFFSSELINNFQETLKTYPNAGLLDVGANEGFFTLLAAKLGRNVISVEPFEDNILLIQDAARRNEFADKITLIQNAVSNKYDKIPFSGSVGGNKKEDQSSYQQTIYVESITLENIMSYIAFNDIVIRIDIGGKMKIENLIHATF